MVGIHWIGDDGSEREPLLYQTIWVRDGRIAHMQDFRHKADALRRRSPAVKPDRRPPVMRGAGRIVGVEPIFSVADVSSAVAHYRRLGFTISYHDAFYAFAHRDGLTVHLAQADAARRVGAIYLHVDDADRIAAEWRGMGLEVVGPDDFDYGKHEGSHTDLDGNLIRFGSPLRDADHQRSSGNSG